MKQIALLAFLMVIAPMALASAAVLHVPAQYATITAALAACAAGDTVKVEAGTYSPSETGETYPLNIVVGGIHLLGAGMGLAILDAEETGRVIFHNAPGGGRISGFTITGGLSERGSGIWIRQSDPEIDHNLVIGNTATARAAGVYLDQNATPWIHHNVIWESRDGVPGDSVDPHGVVIEGNPAGIFEHNLVGRTDGNGLLTGGTANPVVRHNIHYENGTPGPPPNGRGICWFSSAGPLVVHNRSSATLPDPLAGRGRGRQRRRGELWTPRRVYGNLDGDPLFVDDDNLDFHLQPTSPAIDAGDPALPGDPDGTVADIGPFYFDQGIVSVPSGDGGGLVESLRGSPNPFRGSTQIYFSLRETAAVRIDIVDARDAACARYTPGVVGGAGGLRWDGRDQRGASVASGVYFLRVTSAGETRGLPLVLLR